MRPTDMDLILKKTDATSCKVDADSIISSFNAIQKKCSLSDCEEIFSECDTALGEYNRNPDNVN